MIYRHPFFATATLALACCIGSEDAQAAAKGDAWVSMGGIYPMIHQAETPDENAFRELKSEVLIGEISPFWPTSLARENANATLWFSVDYAGHWPARDWRPILMTKLTTGFEARLPVTDMNVPIVYYVAAESGGKTLISPMRITLPRELGLQKPSTVFWPFLDGFEESANSWRIVGSVSNAEAISVTPHAHTGNAALRASIPGGKRSVAIETTRIRGWHFQTQGATGIRLWLKTSATNALARFSLTAHARTGRATVTRATAEAQLSRDWKAVSLPMDVFPSARLGETDLFTIEFIAGGPAEFFIDDLQLTGRWQMPGHSRKPR